MQRSFGLQIFALENSRSVSVQELTDEEAEKIVGGSIQRKIHAPKSWGGSKHLSDLWGEAFDFGSEGCNDKPPSD